MCDNNMNSDNNNDNSDYNLIKKTFHFKCV